MAIGKLGHDVFRRLGEIDIPTFSFINGLALGGGLEVGLHCHYRTVASTAFTALPEVFLGLVPGWGGATILPKLIGPERAVQVIMLNALNNNTMKLTRRDRNLFSKLAKSHCHELNPTNHANNCDELRDLKDATAMNVATSQKAIAMNSANPEAIAMFSSVATVTVMLHSQ